MTTDHTSGLVTEGDLRSFFHASIHAALANQKVEADEATAAYLVNLLADYSRADRLFSHTADGLTLVPLAELYRHALEANSTRERHLFLRRLGDVALFISGLFSGWFKRRLVDVDYYVAMGGSAYGYLSDVDAPGTRGQGLSSIFAQLSRQFVPFMDVLAEVGQNAPGAREQDPLRLHELWTKTGSRRAEQRLLDLGVTPSRSLLAH